MKTKIFNLLALICIACLLISCPYFSEVAIDNPNIKVDRNLLGKWISSDDLEKENPEYYEINEHDEYRYDILKYTYGDSTYSHNSYISHITEVDGATFLNMSMDETGFYLYKIEMDEKSFTLYEITDNIDEKFTKSEELKEFIKKNKNLSFFYNKSEKKYIKQ